MNATQFSLVYHIDRVAKNKIIKKEYINLANLWVSDPIKHKPTLLTLDSQGQIVAQQENIRRALEGSIY